MRAFVATIFLVVVLLPGVGRAEAPSLRDCDQCPEMVTIPAGSFDMGSDYGPLNEKPVHRVAVKGFALGRYEVTRGEYAAFVAETGYRVEGKCVVFEAGEGWSVKGDHAWDNPGIVQTDRHPVVCVSWNDAKAYLAWLGGKTGRAYRLPSEAEWEYAGRAGTTGLYLWGDGVPPEAANCNGCESRFRSSPVDLRNCSFADVCSDKLRRVGTTPVGSFPPNAFGLHDMFGNVGEWVEDCSSDNFEGAPTDGRPWIEGADCRYRGHRGGSWTSFPKNLRSADRNNKSVKARYWSLGLRVAYDLP